MKTVHEWLKDNGCGAIPEKANAEWFVKHNLPMIVECSCCGMTMAMPNSFVDDKGYVYCADCGGNGNE